MSKNLENIRDKFRLAQPWWHHPILHLGVNFTFLMATVLFCLMQIDHFHWIFLLIALGVFILGDFVVWLVHRFPLHRPYRLHRYSYQKHTEFHHRFFEGVVTYRDWRDLFTIFFPMEVILSFCLLVIPFLSVILPMFLPHDFSFFFLAMVASYFLLYELVHWISHLPLTHFVFKVEYLKSMRRHHEIHHLPGKMRDYNFGIVSNISDRLFKTYLGD